MLLIGSEAWYAQMEQSSSRALDVMQWYTVDIHAILPLVMSGVLQPAPAGVF